MTTNFYIFIFFCALWFVLDFLATHKATTKYEWAIYASGFLACLFSIVDMSSLSMAFLLILIWCWNLVGSNQRMNKIRKFLEESNKRKEEFAVYLNKQQEYKGKRD